MEVLSSTASLLKRRKINSSYEDDGELVTVNSSEKSLEHSPSQPAVELRSTDLKVESVKIEIPKVLDSKLSGKRGNLEEILKSPRKKKSPAAGFDLKNIAAKVILAEEIEEFFKEAEKKEQKRFLEKYNFDIVKDVPLEGHYEWTRLKPHE